MSYRKIDFVPTHTQTGFFVEAASVIKAYSTKCSLGLLERDHAYLDEQSPDRHYLSVEFQRPEENARCGLTVSTGTSFKEDPVVEDPEGTVWIILNVKAEANWSAEAGTTSQIARNRLRLCSDAVGLAEEIEALTSGNPVYVRMFTKAEKEENMRQASIVRIKDGVKDLIKGLRVSAKNGAFADEGYLWLNEMPIGTYKDIKIKNRMYSAVVSVGASNNQFIEITRTA